MATETLYFSESQASESYKLVRIAREFRSMTWNNNGAHITIAGFLRGGLLEMTEESRGKIQDQVRVRMAEKRDVLVALGVMASDILLLEPDQYLPITEHLIVITTETAPRGITFPAPPGYNAPLRPGTGSGESSGPKTTRTFDKKQNGKESAEVEMKVWDHEHRRWVSEGSVTVKVGPNGLEEGGAEVTAFVQRARRRGVKVEFAVKGSASISPGGGKVEWEAKIKKALTIQLPSGIKLESAVGVDQHGIPSLTLGVEFP